MLVIGIHSSVWETSPTKLTLKSALLTKRIGTSHRVYQARAHGGYALVGCTMSEGAGDWDFWLVKTDADGNMQWNQTYGGIDEDKARVVIQTVDGGYVIAGQTWSFGAGDSDAWLCRLAPVGIPAPVDIDPTH